MSYKPDEYVIEMMKCASMSNARFKNQAIKTYKTIRTDKIKNQAQSIKKKLLDEKEKCEICGFSYKPILQIHHIVPINKLGNNDEDNIICVCPNCHKLLHHLYKTFDSDKDIDFKYVCSCTNYSSLELKKLIDVFMKYIKGRVEIYEYIENLRFENSSEE